MSPVPSTPRTPSGDGRTVRGARSCTLCRQMKARCNATEQYPNPCSRCAHLGKGPCLIEPSFRRVNKRARIAEIQSELEQLKNSVKQRSGSIVSHAVSDYSDGRHSYVPSEVTRNGPFSPATSPYVSSFTRNEDSYRQVGLTGRIDSASEDELFLTFFTKFHPNLPIVDNTLTASQTYSLCPLLYHTILFLGTLATPNHTLTWSLSQTVNSAAPQHVLSPTKSVHVVQAFLLLATWPQTHLQGSTIHDQAWMYVSVATHMAQCLGLHRSFLSSEYSSGRNETNENTRREWVRTWIGCFIVSQFLSTALGVDPIITEEDFTIQNAPALLSPTTSSTYDPALSLLLDKLKMARAGARITGLLSSCPNTSSGLAEVGDNLAIFRVLQGDVQEVEASLLNADEAHGLSFLWVKLQLYSYALHDGMLPHSAREEFILRGFEASYHFLEAFSTTVATTPLSLLPALHPFSAVCSWMFVLKTLYSRYRVYLDPSRTEKILKEIQQVMSKSQSRGDFCWRAGIYMEHLIQDAKAKEQTLGEPFLGVRSRMAAGLYYDGLGRLTELMNSGDPFANVFETKVMITSPPSVTLSSLTSSPFLSSDDLSTPATSQVAAPSESFNEKPMFSEFWTEQQALENTFVAEPSRLDLEWLADSFLTGEGGVAPSDISSFVAPGMLELKCI